MICDLKQHSGLVSALRDRLGAAVYETHISTVLVADGHAWKIKKPVDLGFLDFSTLAKRKHACEEEIRLNGRLAPDIYQRVAAISGTLDDPVIDGDGEPIEYAVQMREFPADALLARETSLLNGDLVDEIAEQVALFQREAEAAPPDSDFGQPDAVLAPMQQNFEQILAGIDDASDRQRFEALQAWTLEQYASLQPELEKRFMDGRIREGHGDMHLGNIAVEEGRVIIFDGIEFNANLRWIDVINEIAFLMMDLDRIGRRDLSQRFLNRWLAYSGDFDGVKLLRFYLVYRAMVRTKIAVLRLAQEMPADERSQVIEAYREYLSLGEEYIRPLQPAMILMSGPSGSGKSVVTRRLFASMPVIQLASDIERKRLAGFDPLEKTESGPGKGIYSSEMGRKTYERLLTLCRRVTAAGYIAVADATFLKQDQRRPFAELAQALGLPFLILEMKTPVDVLRQRVADRLQRGDDPAEADIAVLEAQLASMEALTHEERQHALVITPEVADSAQLVERIEVRLQT